MHSRNPKEESRNLHSSAKQVDPQAKADSEERLASQIKRIVRRVTRSGRARSLLDQYILSEAEKVTRTPRFRIAARAASVENADRGITARYSNQKSKRSPLMTR